jgi:hypothetical protein
MRRCCPGPCLVPAWSLLGPSGERQGAAFLVRAPTGTVEGPKPVADGPTLSRTSQSQGSESSRDLGSFCPRITLFRDYPSSHPPREQRIDLLNGPSRASLCLAKSPLSQAASCCGLFLKLIKYKATQVEEAGHAISIGFAGGFAQISKLRQLGSGRGQFLALQTPPQ